MIQEDREWYGLSPLQAGMLFEALRVGRHAGYDLEQLQVSLSEVVDAPALVTAWQDVVNRHDALRARFRWERVATPGQSVAAVVSLPTEFTDLSSLSEAARACAFAQFLETDRARGFDLRIAPLSRLQLFRFGPEQTEVVWTVHHLLLDAHSLQSVLREVFATYDALKAGTRTTAVRKSRVHREYIEWLASLDSTASRAFFRNVLAGRSGTTPLPFADLVGPARAGGYAQLRRSSDRELPHALRSLAARAGVSLGIAVQAAWALVLSRYTAEEDVLFGATRTCRRSPLEGALADVVGLFANVVPVRVLLDDRRTLHALLGELQQGNLALRAHEHMPLFELERSASARCSPLFQTTFTFHASDAKVTLESGGSSAGCRRYTLHEQPVPPLNVKVSVATEVEVCIVYDARLPASGVESLANSLIFVLAEFARDDQRRLGDISVLPPREVERVLLEWNRTEHPLAGAALIHQPFESAVDWQPEAPALIAGKVRLTYRELDARANQLAHALQRKGARAGRFVAICVGRRAELLVALLAVAKSGAAFLPLDPRYPASRLCFTLEDSEACCVVTTLAEEHLFAKHSKICVDDAEFMATLPQTRPLCTSATTDVCYAIYTSGTTGAPNGVLVSHRAVVNTLDWVNRTFEVSAADRALFVTSVCFDLSVYDTFGVLAAGATIVMASESELNDPSKLARLVVDRQISVWNSTPATFGALLPYLPADAGATLRLILLSGDWIPVALASEVRQRFPTTKLVSLGGATEAAIWSNWFLIEHVDPAWPSIPYGAPIQNCRYHVLDRAMRPLPVLVPGDLYIGGSCLAEGYLKRAELTEQRFVADPFVHGERLYKTGDRAEYLQDGQLRLLGRQDSQVKIRGFRVELGEVEAAVMRICGVQQAVATTHVDASGERSIGVFVVLAHGSALDAQEIRRTLNESLPTFAVPSQIELLAELPLSKNGKVDRRALPAPREERYSQSWVAPRNAAEQRMVELWESLLQKRPVGVTDDFFALGGHSLLALKFISRLSSEQGLEAPLERLILHPTIEGFLQAGADSALSREPMHLLRFNRTGTRPPIVFFPGVYGTLFLFRDLPQLFGSEQPIILAQAIGVDPSDPPQPSIEQMAAIYEAELLTAVPSGPFVLAGFSFGMLVAHELGRRLRERGVETPLLVSLDGLAPGYPEFLPMKQRLLAHARELLGRRRRRYLLDRLDNTRRRLLRAFGREHELSPEVLSATPNMRLRIKRLFAINIEASLRYRPVPTYDGQMLLIRAEEPERWVGIKGPDPHHGWGAFIRAPISVVRVPGDHGAILDGVNQPRIVQVIRDCLERVIAGTPVADTAGF